MITHKCIDCGARLVTDAEVRRIETSFREGAEAFSRLASAVRELEERERVLLDFIDGEILRARVLASGYSTEDERRGSSYERALQGVRVWLTNEKLPKDARCEHDWPEWRDTPNEGEQTRRCRRCETVDYRHNRGGEGWEASTRFTDAGV